MAVGARRRAPTGGVPVPPALVLIHGWNGWPGNWRPIAAGLRAAGYDVYTPRLPVRPLAGSIRPDADALRRFLTATRRGGRPLSEQAVILCGYSRGGLVARAYVRTYGGEQVAGMVHVGVPHLGCPWGRLRLLRPVAGLAELTAGSPVLHWLNANPEELDRIPQLAICGRADDWQGPNDLIVWEDSATLGGRIPAACLALGPDAWHGNLINRAWIRVPLVAFAASDRCWPLTLSHIRGFAARLGHPSRPSADAQKKCPPAGGGHGGKGRLFL